MSNSVAAEDHRSLGAALDLFSFSDYSPGIAFWHPRGMVVYNQLLNLIREEYEKRGFDEVRAPQVLSSELWKKSGHYELYKKNMFFLESEGQEFALKPMNCPGHCVMVGQKIRSYREFPIRYAEMSPLHRNEESGSLNGLKRVRSFSQDDAHIFCRPDQVADEVYQNIDFLDFIYKILGFNKVKVELSLRPAESIGSDELWKQAEDALREALSKAGIDYKENPGDGAFYGPKIDFHIEDSFGKSVQCGTIQLDFNLPKRFELKYRDEANALQEPVMVHRAIYGSFERMIACLLEHHQGNLPCWLAPEQIRILPIGQDHLSYVQDFASGLKLAKIRASIDDKDSLNNRIKNSKLMKVPFIGIVGKKEIDSNSISIRFRDDSNKVMGLSNLVSMIHDLNAKRG